VARFLALDWAQRRIRLVSASAGRGKVRIEQALVWGEEEALTPASAEALGQRLREGLRQARISPAPLLVCLGREQVILKEIRYPKSAPAQEPALVRFQASKELTETPESVVIDYAPLDRPGPSGEQRALIFVARRDLVNAFKTMCKAAGLKALALTVRPLGLAACLRLSAGLNLGEPPVAAAVVADGWAEFCVARGPTLLFARPLPAVNGGLEDEVRRDLALYAGQPQAAPVQALYAAGDGAQAGLRQRLEDAVTIPVHPLDPFAHTDGAAPATDRAGYAGAVGLLQLWAERQAVPVNFLAPKEPTVEINTGKRKALRAAGVAVLAVMVAMFLGNLVLASKRTQLQKLQGERDDIDAQLTELQPAKRSLDALKDWHKTALPLLDEIYDLSARFPFKDGLRVTKLDIMPLAVKATSKDPSQKSIYTMHMTVTGVVNQDDSGLVESLVDAINQDPYCRASRSGLKSLSGGGADGERGQKEFKVDIDIAPRPANKYNLRLVPPPPQVMASEGPEQMRPMPKFPWKKKKIRP
jgi:Tfp pilus assembly PilM family ATPase